jgi:hypothetical protein
MADQNQTPPAPSASPAPIESPEPDIDSLLANIPELKGVFGDDPGDAAPKRTEPVSEAAATGTEEEIQPGLDPALPLVEEPELIEEPEPEPEEEDVKPEKQDSVQKRIDKLTAARRAAEEEATALKAELTELKAKAHALPPVVPTAQNPLANVEDPKELVRRVELSRQAKSWAIQHLDGGEIQLDDGNTKFLSGDQVKVLLARAEDMLDTHIPRQGQFLAQKAEWDKQAKAAYPNLFKPGHKDNLEYNSWQTVFPEMRKFPDISIIVGDAILGRQLRLQREAAKKNGASANGNNLPLSAPAPAAAPRVPRNRALSGAELSAIATDPQGGALDKFVHQLIAEAEQSRPAQRTKR